MSYEWIFCEYFILYVLCSIQLLEVAVHWNEAYKISFAQQTRKKNGFDVFIRIRYIYSTQLKICHCKFKNLLYFIASGVCIKCIWIYINIGIFIWKKKRILDGIYITDFKSQISLRECQWYFHHKIFMIFTVAYSVFLLFFYYLIGLSTENEQNIQILKEKRRTWMVLLLIILSEAFLWEFAWKKMKIFFQFSVYSIWNGFCSFWITQEMVNLDLNHWN